MTYSDAIEFLYSLRWYGTKLGLTHTIELARLAGNPHQQLRFIHVAGTNGKGSTCAMLESVYRVSGRKVGLFTSPHLVAFGERIQVNRRLISEADVLRLVGEFQPLLKRFPAESHPTFFEVVTVMALRYFVEQGCDLVIWETGLGGRLDATNIVTPLMSVITNIQYDHQKWLGNSLAEIASEKAGIIKPGIPVATAAEEPEALAVIEQKAREQNAPLIRVAPAQTSESPLDTITLPLPGAHQRLNAALALAVVRQLQSVLPVSETHIREGLTRVFWAGRLQLATLPSGQRLLLDGAHNLAGAQQLRAALRQSFSGEEITLVLGVLEDKDWAGMCRELAPLAQRILLAPVHTDRTAHPHSLAEFCQSISPHAEVREFPDLAQALAAAKEDPFVLICGSLYLIGEAMELLKLSPVPSEDERGLNDWGQPRSSR